MLEASQGKKNGQPVDNQNLALAFRYQNMIDLGMEIGLDDVPNVFILDLLTIIYEEEQKLKKEKQEEMERKAKQAGR